MCVFIPQVLETIIQEYAEEVLPPVITPEQWNQIAENFQTKWNFPHASGAIDGSRRNLTEEERIFNYMLSRARRVVENAFGILAMRFHCMLGCLNQCPDTVDSIVLACDTT